MSNDQTRIISRREWMLTTGSGLALSLVPLSGVQATSVSDRGKFSRPDILLVHGAWHGGWCYRRVADILTGLGHRVFAPTLTGLADRSHLLTTNVTLTTHIQDIVNLVRWEELDKFILVGHSYGGMVISGATEQIGANKIQSLVFLDAFLPKNGQSLVDQSDVSRQMVKNNPTALLEPIPAAVFQVNEADREWVDRQCTPQPLKTFTEALTLSDIRDKVSKKLYVRAANYEQPAFDSFFDMAKSDPRWSAHHLQCGHDVMLDMPEEVAKLISSSA
ncbi:MAG: alpha/beta fold hydrolase [Advenella sp.]|uniref:Alpha/beta hydrolase n=1 Tax=Advenella kashmirensis TaxID=310575 RepID=A0A356LBS7_9BURK|nr:alpha/beta hydrolase [Advenella sp. FME57]HBP28011.1 alpha/beta hydrolase [Advenella kashmirensis]